MKKRTLVCVCIAATLATLFTACSRTPVRNLKVRTDTAPIQALLPNIDIQECVWVDIRSGSIFGAMIPDAYYFGVIALSDQQIQDMTAAFEWTEPDYLNIEEDLMFLVQKYFGVAEPDLMRLVVSGSFNEQSTPEHYSSGFYLAEKERLLLFGFSQM